MQAFLDWLDELDMAPNAPLMLCDARWRWGDVQSSLKDDLLLSFESLQANWTDSDAPHATWQITAHGCTEYRVHLGLLKSWPDLKPDYPRLTVARLPTRQLGFAAAPKDTKQMLSDLRELHDEKQWDFFGKYGLGENLELGYGMFANGPEALLALYFPVLEAHGMRPSWIGEPRPPRDMPLECLVLGGTVWRDDTYVLAESFTAVRLE